MGAVMSGTRSVGRVGLALLVCAGAAWVVAAQSNSRAATGTPEQNKALVRRWINEGFNARRPDVVNEVFAETVVINGQPTSRARLRQNMAQRLTAFPDLEVTITEMLAEGNKVAIWYTARGTHRAEFEGVAPTGRRVTWDGADLLHIAGQTIAEGRFLDDSLGLLRQLGPQPPLLPGAR
jgi:predicted ester cyclase